jgi:cyanate permease
MGQSKIYYGWIIVCVVWLIYFSNVGLLLYGAPAINAGMMAVSGLNEAVVGTAVAICTACQGIFSPVTGLITRRKGVRGLFIAGSAILCGGSALLSFLRPTAGLFIPVYGLLFGIGMTLGGILTAQSTLNNWFDKKKGLALSIALSAGGVSGFLAPPLTEGIVSRWSWQAGWRFIAVMCGLSLVVSVIFMVNRPGDMNLNLDGAAEKPKEKTTQHIPTLGTVFRSKKIYLIVCGIVTRYMLYYAVITHLIIFLKQRGMGAPQAAGAISVLSLSSLGGRFVAGIAGGKRRRAGLFLALANFLSAAGLLLLIPAQTLVVFYAASLCIGLGTGIGYIAQPLVISNEFGAENFPVLNGYIYPANYIIGALGPLFAGIGASAGGTYIPVFTVLAAACGAGGLVLLFIKKEGEKA